MEKFRRGKPHDINLTLRASYRDLLAKLGNPQDHLPPVIHVAGTNGKGSVCAFLRAMVEEAGYKAHVYTSPHLISFNERIRIAGKLIEDVELEEILLECERLSPPEEITYFEAATAAAFTAFMRHPADVSIIEVGLGGRLDATNVINHSVATVIARLSFDHIEFLGNTMANIAAEKAGIMREKVPCFLAPQPDAAALASLWRAASALNSPLIVGGREWRVEKINEQSFRFISKNRVLDLPNPALFGEHQLWNAGLAIAASSALPLKITDDAMRRAMGSVEWPARLQRLESGKLHALLPPGWELWLDGGHNDSAGEVLAAQAGKWVHDKKSLPLAIVCGMMASKYPSEFISPLIPFISNIRTVDIPDEPLCLKAEEISRTIKYMGFDNVAPVSSVEQAISDIVSAAKEPTRILVCGSLYLSGYVLRVS
ncbi:MAG: bifunctional folylpolyglutamate synthase/dihydrofolate synthase [Alphaproteobacteria bacterium]|nr:bifunctional folylpolyglutamate synthase/dihydrofolate synthase [Alphaproteobacteria bacterium]